MSTQRTAISNPYHMESAPKVRTPIGLEVGTDRAYCYGCGRDILPRIIKSKFIGSKRHTLAACPACNSVIQDPPAKPNEPKKKQQSTVFVWRCEECQAEHLEHKHLPVAIGPEGQTCRVCSECFGEAHLVEK